MIRVDPGITPEAVLHAAAEAFDTTIHALQGGDQRFALARAVARHVGYRLCGQAADVVAARMGRCSAGAVVEAFEAVRLRMEHDRALRRKVEIVEACLLGLHKRGRLAPAGVPDTTAIAQAVLRGGIRAATGVSAGETFALAQRMLCLETIAEGAAALLRCNINGADELSRAFIDSLRAELAMQGFSTLPAPEQQNGQS